MTTRLSVLIPVRNDAKNLAKCLHALRGWADEVVIVDSGSTDGTADIAREFGAKVVQFRYEGGWPKKRQWALDTYPWANEWVLLLDADEIVTELAREEISTAIKTTEYAGYRLNFRIVFLGRMLSFGDTALSKLSLIRRGCGRYERRLEGQTKEMGDMEVHEHVVVDGPVGVIKSPVRHENLNSLHHYIDKHNSYSTWEAQVHFHGVETELRPSLFGTQAQRRRWLKQRLLAVPGFPVLVFLYVYLLRLGVLDGGPGLHYAMFRMIQYMHIKAKIYEHRRTLSAIGFHDQMAGEWEAKYQKRSFVSRREMIESLLEGHDLAGRRWLDAGCGSGHLARLLAERGCMVEAVDASHSMIRTATEQAGKHGLSDRIAFRQVQSIESMSLPASSFDGAICISVLEYLDDPAGALEQLRNAIRPEGTLFISVPNRISLFRRCLHAAYRLTGRPSYLKHSRNEYSQEQFAQLLASHGFTVESATYLGGPLPQSLQRSRHFGPLCMFAARRSAVAQPVHSA